MLETAIELLKPFEGFREQAYPDPIHGWKVPTIGYGTTKYPDGTPVRRGDRISRATAEQCLRIKLERDIVPELAKIPTWKGMSKNQQAALVDFGYNLGEHFYGGKKFTSITRLCDSPKSWADAKSVRDTFVKYRNPGTSAEAGLRRRRLAEADLWLKRAA